MLVLNSVENTRWMFSEVLFNQGMWGTTRSWRKEGRGGGRYMNEASCIEYYVYYAILSM